MVLLLTSEWKGRDLLQYVPIYNRWDDLNFEMKNHLKLIFQFKVTPKSYFQEVHQLQGEGHVNSTL